MPLFEDEVSQAFATYVVIVILKMMLMAPLTAYYRLSRGAFANEEDVSLKGNDKHKFLRSHPDVERVRRCHQNDLENILPFVLIGLLYSMTRPDVSVALLHFRVFAGSRIIHSLAYLVPLPQPSRAFSWMTGMVVTFSMAFRVLSSFAYF